MRRWLLPNLLTIARLLLACLFPFTAEPWRVVLVVAAGLSDLFDGMFSRALGSTSRFGKVLDPIADKAFIGAVLITLLVEQRLQLWEVTLIALRDFAVLFGGALVWLLKARGTLRDMSPILSGKLATVLQFAFLVCVLVMQKPPAWLFWLTVVASGVAGVDYLRVLFSLRRQTPSPSDRHAPPTDQP